MLRIYQPPNYIEERLYVWSVLFGEFLGIEYRISVEEREDVRICLQGDESGKELLLSDVLFQTREEAWLTASVLPSKPLLCWDVSESPFRPLVVDSQVPIIYGKKVGEDQFYEIDGNMVRIGPDLPGSCFFMLTRLEEYVRETRDKHERFPASESLAYQEQFLDRPIVNEYVEILWSALTYLWPVLPRNKRESRLLLSHDVDWPLYTQGRSWGEVLRNSVGDLVKRKNGSFACQRVQGKFLSMFGNYRSDPYNRFDWIMDISEDKGTQSAFYFITDHSAGHIDGVYSIDSPWIRNLMKRIHDRGHEVGLHPSYNTFRDFGQIKKERDRLLRACEQENIKQEVWGGRQHFLRFEVPTTWQLWESLGLHYDSSLSYADAVGFRCGVCYEYPVFHLKKRQMLQLRERPLLVMEATLLHNSYMNLTIEEAWEVVNELKKRALMFGGDFTLLWHNSSLEDEQTMDFYKNIVLQF